MNQEQKDFILNELIPFIQREQGNGFAMEVWAEPAEQVLDTKTPENDARHDISFPVRPAPACGTVCCIGGSIDYLRVRKENPGLDRDELLSWMRVFSVSSTAHYIGLTFEDAEHLFYVGHWPWRFRDRWMETKNAGEQADLACELLREIVRTDGKIINSHADDFYRKIL